MAPEDRSSTRPIRVVDGSPGIHLATGQHSRHWDVDWGPA